MRSTLIKFVNEQTIIEEDDKEDVVHGEQLTSMD